MTEEEWVGEAPYSMRERLSCKLPAPPPFVTPPMTPCTAYLQLLESAVLDFGLVCRPHLGCMLLCATGLHPQVWPIPRLEWGCLTRWRVTRELCLLCHGLRHRLRAYGATATTAVCLCSTVTQTSAPSSTLLLLMLLLLMLLLLVVGALCSCMLGHVRVARPRVGRLHVPRWWVEGPSRWRSGWIPAPRRRRRCVAIAGVGAPH